GLDLGVLRSPELRPEGVVREAARGDRLGAGFVCRAAEVLVALRGGRGVVLGEAVLDEDQELRVGDALRPGCRCRGRPRGGGRRRRRLREELRPEVIRRQAARVDRLLADLTHYRGALLPLAGPFVRGLAFLDQRVDL